MKKERDSVGRFREGKMVKRPEKVIGADGKRENKEG